MSRTRTTTRRATVPAVAAAILLAVAPAIAAPLYIADVYCEADFCGSMEIDTYDVLNPTVAKPSGGVVIDGQFRIARPLKYHYLQAVTTDDSDVVRWFNDTSIPLSVPYLDTPPGGYKAQTAVGSGNYTVNDPWDDLPWYDEGEFPTFYDAPRNDVRYAKAQADRISTVYFETWLVCVILDMHNGNGLAWDDYYKVAPLIGWTWGFDITYNDVNPLGVDDLGDFTVTKRDFSWQLAPSAAWTSALGTIYGRTTEDYFNIAVGDCKDCEVVPEPGTLVLVTFGLAGLVKRRRG